MEIKTIGKINENPTQHSTDAPSEGGETTAEEDNNSNVLVCTGKQKSLMFSEPLSCSLSTTFNVLIS